MCLCNISADIITVVTILQRTILLNCEKTEKLSAKLPTFHNLNGTT